MKNCYKVGLYEPMSTTLFATVFVAAKTITEAIKKAECEYPNVTLVAQTVELVAWEMI